MKHEDLVMDVEEALILHPTRRVVWPLIEGNLTSEFEESRAFGRTVLVPMLVVRVGVEISYAEYLRSPEWREYRGAIFDRQGGRCAMCPKAARHCHHRTYANLGWEANEDCVGVCADCHGNHHRVRA